MTQIQQWSALTRLQLGQYAEYFVMMAFTSHGFDVYTPEIDDKGIDCLIRKEIGQYYEIQVKSLRGLNYIFLQKDKFLLNPNNLLTVVLFTEGQQPDLYLIPSMIWHTPNRLFVENDYIGKKSKPEWGMNLSKRNLPLLEPYMFNEQVKNL